MASVNCITPTQKAYEVFLRGHQKLVVFFIVGYYYHIWERYGYNRGHEIWAFVAVAIWVFERAARYLRVGLVGKKMATVSPVEGSNGEYIRVDVEDAFIEGVAYLYFPTLSWRVLENHPFSIFSSLSTPRVSNSAPTDARKGTVSANVTTPAVKSSPHSKTTVSITVPVRSGMTARLAARISAANRPVRIPVFLKSSYHASAAQQVAQCTRILAMAGGVGLGAVLPILQRLENRPARLCGSVRNSSLVGVFKDELDSLAVTVAVETHIGSRMDARSILRGELTVSCGPGDQGPIGVIVSGPPGMADDVRNSICSLSRTLGVKRGVVFIDEAFSW